RWTFDGQLLNADFNQSDIFVLIQRPDGVYLERINLSRDITRAMTTTQFPVHLDRRVILEGAGATLPYTENAIVYVSANGKLLSQSAVATELAAGRK
ncbi:hypothetical protein BSN82_17490, partial [Acinetobacter baylyi]